ncbi:hypothetical protein ACFL6Y_07325 [Elusimicrobiota bacterium]
MDCREYAWDLQNIEFYDDSADQLLSVGVDIVDLYDTSLGDSYVEANNMDFWTQNIHDMRSLHEKLDYMLDAEADEEIAYNWHEKITLFDQDLEEKPRSHVGCEIKLLQWQCIGALVLSDYISMHGVVDPDEPAKVTYEEYLQERQESLGGNVSGLFRWFDNDLKLAKRCEDGNIAAAFKTGEEDHEEVTTSVTAGVKCGFSNIASFWNKAAGFLIEVGAEDAQFYFGDREGANQAGQFAQIFYEGSDYIKCKLNLAGIGKFVSLAVEYGLDPGNFLMVGGANAVFGKIGAKQFAKITLKTAGRETVEAVVIGAGMEGAALIDPKLGMLVAFLPISGGGKAKKGIGDLADDAVDNYSKHRKKAEGFADDAAGSGSVGKLKRGPDSPYESFGGIPGKAPSTTPLHGADQKYLFDPVTGNVRWIDPNNPLGCERCLTVEYDPKLKALITPPGVDSRTMSNAMEAVSSERRKTALVNSMARADDLDLQFKAKSLFKWNSSKHLQKNGTCVLHAFDNIFKYFNYDDIERLAIKKFGKQVLHKGLNNTRIMEFGTDLWVNAIGMGRGNIGGWSSISEALEAIARTKRPVLAALGLGKYGSHAVVMLGTLEHKGKTYVALIDSNSKRTTFMAMDEFDEVAENFFVSFEDAGPRLRLPDD